MKHFIMIFCVISILFSLTGCLPNQGAVTLHIMIAGKHLPDLSNESFTYHVTAAGPNGELEEFITEFNEPVLVGLAYGEWDFLVNAFGFTDLLLIGERTYAINSPETKEVNVFLQPSSEGNAMGNINITVNWDPDRFVDADVNAFLVSEGEDIDLSFDEIDQEAGIAYFLGESHESGYYGLIVNILYRGTHCISSIVTDLGLVKDKDTNITINFESEFDDKVIPDYLAADQVDVVLSNFNTVLAIDETEQVTVVNPPGPGNSIVIWYIDNTPIALGDTFTVTGFPEGLYTLYATSLNIEDNMQGISDTVSFRITANSTEYIENFEDGDSNGWAFDHGNDDGEVTVQGEVTHNSSSYALEIYDDGPFPTWWAAFKPFDEYAINGETGNLSLWININDYNNDYYHGYYIYLTADTTDTWIGILEFNPGNVGTRGTRISINSGEDLFARDWEWVDDDTTWYNISFWIDDTNELFSVRITDESGTVRFAAFLIPYENQNPSGGAAGINIMTYSGTIGKIRIDDLVINE